MILRRTISYLMISKMHFDVVNKVMALLQSSMIFVVLSLRYAEMGCFDLETRNLVNWFM